MESNGNGCACKSLESFLSKALTEASEAHTQCCHNNSDWAPFYASFLAKRLTPLLCAIQSYVDTKLVERLAPVNTSWVNPRNLVGHDVPVATVKGHWDRGTIDREAHSEDGGPLSWFLR